MSRLDLIEAGLITKPVRYNRTPGMITGCCPAHGGPEGCFKAIERTDGRVVMFCLSGCERDDLMACMGLYIDQPGFECLSHEIRNQYGRKLHSQDGIVCALADHDKQQGIRMQGSDIDRYRDCLRRLYSQRGAA